MALITYLSRIHFAVGAIRLLPEELGLSGANRPLVVSDPGVRDAGLVDRALETIGRKGVALYAETPSNPTEDAVLAALQVYGEQGCDGLVAVGGGSAIDLGKAVALLATHPGGLDEYGVLNGGMERIRTIAPVIAVPTTAGTGAEVGRASSITLKSGRKIACVSPHLIPTAALCDPELTYGLPPGMTAGTGMDALSHGIETFLSNRVNPPAEAIALDCVRRASRHIGRAVADGSDREARWHMLMAALEGGLAFQKGLGAVHALSHPLGELGLHHGTLNAVLLPAVLRFNADHVGTKYAALGEAIGLPAGADIADWITSLNARLGLPAGLREMGVGDDALPAIAEAAAKDHLSETNPRRASPEDYLRLLGDSMSR